MLPILFAGTILAGSGPKNDPVIYSRLASSIHLVWSVSGQSVATVMQCLGAHALWWDTSVNLVLMKMAGVLKRAAWRELYAFASA
jgi:hypothetical protein